MSSPEASLPGLADPPMAAEQAPAPADWSFARIYSDADGETHFEDVDLLRLEETSWTSAARSLSSGVLAAEGFLFRAVLDEVDEPGYRNPPRNLIVVQLTGSVEVRASDGERRVFGPASVLCVEDVTGRGHVTRRVGDEPRMALYLYPEDDDVG